MKQNFDIQYRTTNDKNLQKNNSQVITKLLAF